GETEGARRELLESRRQGVSTSFSEAKRLLDVALKELATPTVPTPSPAATVTTVAVVAAPAPTVSVPELPAPLPTAVPPFVAPTASSVASDPRSLLRRAIRDFFEGRYERAALDLETPALSRSDVARLFAAYSLCGAYLVGGEA